MNLKSEPQNRRISNNECRRVVSLAQRRRLRRVSLNHFFINMQILTRTLYHPDKNVSAYLRGSAAIYRMIK